MQYWYDSIFPDDLGCTNADDPYIADNSELTMSIVSAMKKTFPDIYDYMEPELKTHISAPRRQNMTEVLLALYKRNYNVPEQDVVDESVEKFVKSYIPHNKLEALTHCTDNPVYPSSEDIESWLIDQDANVRGLIEQDFRSVFENH